MLVGFIIAIILVVAGCIIQLIELERENDKDDRKH